MINWQAINTVLFDMDGTLLDLHYDAQFWGSYLPKHLSAAQQISLEEAHARISERVVRTRGQLTWYCIDDWSDALGIDVAALKPNLAHLIQPRPNALTLLKSLQKLPLRILMVTNAHPASLQVKMAYCPLETFFHRIISSHQVGIAKEATEFWHYLQKEEAFDPSTTALFDDTAAVLASAEHYGIAHLFDIAQPNSQLAAKASSNYTLIDCFSHILPSDTAHRAFDIHQQGTLTAEPR